MNEFGNERQSLVIPADGIRSLNISSKNYRIRIVSGNEESFILRFCNNRFRMLEVTPRGDCLNLSEKMAVTFYEFFRFVELMRENELLVELPQNCETLSIVARTGPTGILVNGVMVQSLQLESGTGEISVYRTDVTKQLAAFSSAGKISCSVLGRPEEYNVSCAADRRDVQNPCYPYHENAMKRIDLHSGMSVPHLCFA
ncbi:MAG: hypothetical protein LUF00_02225 [Lachnospiraceae bacterium]|nr:hypothetical protein [Lachnospiraceae bacterium]